MSGSWIRKRKCEEMDTFSSSSIAFLRRMPLEILLLYPARRTTHLLPLQRRQSRVSIHADESGRECAHLFLPNDNGFKRLLSNVDDELWAKLSASSSRRMRNGKKYLDLELHKLASSVAVNRRERDERVEIGGDVADRQVGWKELACEQ
jgi:hypothetical protein